VAALAEWQLTVLILAPAATAGLLLALGGAARLLFDLEGLPVRVWRAGALLGSAVTALLAVATWWRFDPERSGHQLVEHLPWLPGLGLHYFVGIDGISLLMLMLTAFLVPVALVAVWGEVERSPRTFFFCVLVLETGALGAFASLNLFLFFFFWQSVLLPMTFLVGIWGGAHRIEAARRFFGFASFGSLSLLLGMLVLYALNFEQGGAWNLDFVPSPGSEALGILQTRVPVHTGEWWQTQRWLFVLFLVGFGMQVPLVPLHGWLADTQAEAPTAGSILLPVVGMAMGAYGLLRFVLPILPAAAAAAVPVMLGVGLVGLVYGGLLAIAQSDVKRIVAYGSMAHLGLVVLGLFSLNRHGMTGAVLQLVNHALFTGALFALLGFLVARRGTRELDEFGGLARPMPVFATGLGLAAFASLGLPPLNGFVGEALILLGAFEADPWIGVGALAGGILAAVYLLWLWRRVVLGPLTRPENRGMIDLDWREKLVVTAFVIPILWIGMYPNPLLRRIEPAVSLLLRQMEARVEIQPPELPEMLGSESAARRAPGRGAG